MGMFEVDEAAKFITKSADPEAKIIFGAVLDEEMDEEVKITVVATGFDDGAKTRTEPASRMEEPITVEPQIRRPVFTPKAMDDEIDVSLSKSETPDQDELEIPAFIRKKIK